MIPTCYFRQVPDMRRIDNDSIVYRLQQLWTETEPSEQHGLFVTEWRDIPKVDA